MKKRIVCLVLGFVLLFSQSLTALATTKSEIKQKKAEAESQLNAANERIDDLSDQQAAIQAEISEADADLVDLLIMIDATETDIANTEASIVTKQAEIDQTTAELEIAQANKDKQYQDMKTRIRYIYENGGDSVWFRMILEADDITSLLNRAEYAQSMQKKDREMLAEFVAVVEQVTELKNTLEAQKAELEAQKAELEAQKADLEASKAELQTRLEQMRATSADYDSQIAAVRAQAEEISDLIAQQEA